jgi:A/G-specific adenine glycosylase
MAKQGLSARLLDWYRAHRRDLPWRSDTPDPYAVWLSEIMLQQTTVAAVKDYYRAFLARWPTVGYLAAAPLDDVLKAWAGLGYYARARNLHACARKVAFELGGHFPDTEAGLLALPGIGPYTAGAIAAIAFNRPAAAVDGNVERVISRLYAIEAPLSESKPEIRRLTGSLVPKSAPGDFAQALMDLGATVCTPRNPDCLICPWTEDCAARKAGIAETLPRKAQRKAIPTRRGIAFWIENPEGAVLIRRRPEKGLLGGMMEIPSTLWAPRLPPRPELEAPLALSWDKTDASVLHTFTHFHLELSIWKSAAGPVAAPPDARWVPKRDLHGEALPTVMRKVIEAALGA